VRLTPKTAVVTEKGIAGDVIGLDDPFGSLITDISGENFKKLGYAVGDEVTVQLNKKALKLPYSKTFMDVRVGENLLYIDSRGRVGIAMNQGNFSQVNKVSPPGTIFIAAKELAKRK
jgi:S-adenosyl-L-methionine hydrolase (adenosine-forming)